MTELNYSYPVSIFKSDKEDDERIYITIIPNTPNVDRVGDRILLKAYDEDCRKNFLHSGIIDYDHQSILAKSAREKAEAWIGDPTNFFIDEKNNVPVIEGYLFKSNPYVKNSIYPALKSGSNRVSASLGGKILQKSLNYDVATKKQINDISKITLAHCAITPLQKAVHQEAKVLLKKSFTSNDKTKESSCINTFEFDTFKSFLEFIEDETSIYKTLEAGTQTDSSKITGGQSLQTQSLEGSKINKNKLKYIMPFAINDVMNNKLKGKVKDFHKYFVERGLTDEESKEMVKLLAKNGHKIVKLQF